jgi:mannitol 2-dehydrogenase
MKGRMLNASHILLGYPALLCGHRIVHEALGDPRLKRLIETFLNEDVIPRLDGPKGVSLEAYRDAVLERFANPAVNDQLLRIGLDGASKLPVFHSRTLAMLMDDGGPLDREAFLFACFEAYLKGRDDRGETFPVTEPRLSDADWALIRGGDPLGVLKIAPLAGLGLAGHAGFTEAFLRFKGLIAEGSASKALDAVVARGR